jgi:hypothetical protein
MTEPISNPSVMRIMFDVCKINECRRELVANRRGNDDIVTASRLLNCDIDIVRLLECCLSIEENSTLRGMLERTVKSVETTVELLEMLEARNAAQHLALMQAIHGDTIH